MRAVQVLFNAARDRPTSTSSRRGRNYACLVTITTSSSPTDLIREKKNETKEEDAELERGIGRRARDEDEDAERLETSVLRFHRCNLRVYNEARGTETMEIHGSSSMKFDYLRYRALLGVVLNRSQTRSGG